MKDITVLVTGCGSEGVYGVIKSLRANGERGIRLIGLDTDPLIAHRYVLDQFYIPPRRDTSEFIPFVLDLARQEKVDVVYPVPTAELSLFAGERSRFETQGQRVVISSSASLDIANNKARLYQQIHAMGLPCAPIYSLVHSWEELVEVASAIGYPARRVCIKPPVGTGSQGFRVLDAHLDRLSLLLRSFPTTTLTRLEDLAPVLREAHPFPELVVMEYLPGDEYDVDVLAEAGHCLAVIPRKNARMWYGMSLVCTTEPKTELIEYTKQIVTSLGLSYVVSLSYRFDQAGQAKLIEINPRIPGSIIITTMAGVNMPYLAVKLALGEPIEIPPVHWGVQMIRYWEEIFLSPKGELLPHQDKQHAAGEPQSLKGRQLA